MMKSLRVVLAASIALMGACNGFLNVNNEESAADVYLPAGHDADMNVRWPMIVSLHGAGGLIPSDNLIQVKAMVASTFPVVVLAPKSQGEWSVAYLDGLIREAAKSYRVDTTRIYITGISMGARGAWNLVATYPNRFAAVVPIAGDPNATFACAIKDTPVWLFHNRSDPVVPVAFSEQAYAAHKDCGGETRLTVYETVPAGRWAHNAWQEAWSSNELYEWLLARHR